MRLIFTLSLLTGAQAINPLVLRSPLVKRDTCPASTWPGLPIGTAITAQAPDSILTSYLGSVSAANVKANIEKLVTFGTRHTLSAANPPNSTRGIVAARDWLFSQFSSYAAASGGRMTVEILGYNQPTDTSKRVPFPVRVDDVCATLKGTDEPERIYVISGHYDSRCSDPNDYTSDAPGADDDASGVAVSLELARILATSKPKATIVLCAVAGEEQALLGSTYLAQRYRNASANVAGMFTNDIIGSSTADDGAKDANTIRLFAQGIPPISAGPPGGVAETQTLREQRLQVGGENDSPARELGRFIRSVASNSITEMSVEIIYRLDRYLRGGDHRPFLEAGYAAVRFTEPNENFAHQHQNVRVEGGVQYGDLPEFVDFSYVARVAKVNLAAVWSLANAPATPTNVKVSTAALDNNSTFSWTKSKGATGYEVLYRPTSAPFWTGVVSVGDVATATVNLSKDNVVFGIRAVGAGGYKSPAAFPFPG